MSLIHVTLNRCYDFRHDFNTSLGIIPMIRGTLNHNYDSRDDFNTSLGIVPYDPCGCKILRSGQERYGARTCFLKFYTKCFFSQLNE